MSFASPGVTTDRYAVRDCNLLKLIEGLPLRIYAIGASEMAILQLGIFSITLNHGYSQSC
jgi:hypothetical protein